MTCVTGTLTPQQLGSYTPSVSKLHRERIGVLGGTFDPPHFGHLAAACEVRHRLAMARLLMVVANDPWQKSADAPVTPAGLRLEMVRAATDGIAGIEAGALEVERGGASYTADTLDELRAAHPDAELMLVMGSDAAAGLDSWKRPADLRALATIVVVNRAGGRPECLPAGFQAVAVEVPALDISSRDLRDRFAGGRPVDALMPPAVVRIVRARGLYGARPQGRQPPDPGVPGS